LSELYPQPHKVVIITGGNKGIGFSVLKKLLECEMTVVMGVRRPDECKQTVESELGHLEINGKVFYEKLDIGDMTSVQSFAERIREKFPAVNILINNGKDKQPKIAINDSNSTFFFHFSWNSLIALRSQQRRLCGSNGRELPGPLHAYSPSYSLFETCG
jgi:NAD(P)-dependent dehydrogenase (short-subunit alcohol dehydrogenase family)